jgi:hypothetical protein
LGSLNKQTNKQQKQQRNYTATTCRLIIRTVPCLNQIPEFYHSFVVSLFVYLVSGRTFRESSSSSFLGSTAQFRPWPPPQNPTEFLGGFSTILFFAG